MSAPVSLARCYPARMRTIALVTAAIIGVTGCYSSSYVPRDRRKVYKVMRDGRQGYVRDGQFRAETGFGGGLVESVHGNPGATQAAETFRSRSIGGFAMLMGGSVCLPTVMVYSLARAYENDTRDERGIRSHAYIAAGCALLMIVGGVYLASGMPHQFDAMNIYNDAVDAVPPVQWPPPPAPSLPAYGDGAR